MRHRAPLPAVLTTQIGSYHPPAEGWYGCYTTDQNHCTVEYGGGDRFTYAQVS
jgi:hypothetical protein